MKRRSRAVLRQRLRRSGIASTALRAHTTVLAATLGMMLLAQGAPAQPPPAEQPARTAPEAAASASTTLEQAIAAYDAAQEITGRDERRAAFTRAERLFTAAAQAGAASADLYANIGTAALQAENLGSAILAYRRALRLDPDHRRASQNLQHARTLLPSWVPRPETGGILDSFFAWTRTMSDAERAGGAALAFLLGAVLLGSGTALQSAMLRAFATLPLLLWAVLLASAVTAGAEGDAAVVVADDVIARASDSRNAPARFAEPLPAGTEVRIDERRDDWVRVTLADGRDAWMPAASVELAR
ncbi:MAG TPA: hypothetical protein VEL28_19565 [Candidatus Binatia bacterium]|nr:hypothetical protein [Candidatus Binatia bacterium]